MLKGFLDYAGNDRISGWALETDNSLAELTITIFANDCEMVRGQANGSRPDLMALFGSGNHGFDFRFDPPLSKSETHGISVREAVSNEILHECFLFSSEPTTATSSAELRPLLLSSTGRSGTTIMMSKLKDFSSVTIAGEYPYEIKLLTYYAHAMRVLCSPRFDASVTVENFHQDPYRIGPNPFYSHEYCNLFKDHNRLFQILGSSATRSSLKLFKNLILEFYQAVAADQQTTDPVFFAEKCDVLAGSRDYLKLMFDSRKEILLIRDLRDVYCSSKSFWSAGSDFVRNNLLPAKDALTEIYRTRASDLLLVKYEDLIQSETTVMGSISQFLDQPFFSKADNPDSDLFQKHGTSATPLDSIGRWKRELTSDEIKIFAEDFSDYFRMFGYEL